MIERKVSQTPLRISFAGGGTDLPFFYEKYGGSVISTAIDKYIKVTVEKVEKVEKPVSEVSNPYVRACLEYLGIDQGTALRVESDVLPGSGLGGSSALLSGLLNALSVTPLPPGALAEMACEIEMDILKKPVGKQDAYIAAYGGIRRFEFRTNGNVSPNLAFNEHKELESRLLLFDTGIQRAADEILSDQQQRNNVESLKRIKTLVPQFHDALRLTGTLDDVGRLLDENWKLKRGLADSISNDRLDMIYEAAKKAGALGGKLLGAGGGGHFLFYVPLSHQKSVKTTLEGWMTEKPLRFESEGSRILKHEWFD